MLETFSETAWVYVNKITGQPIKNRKHFIHLMREKPTLANCYTYGRMHDCQVVPRKCVISFAPGHVHWPPIKHY